MMTEKERLENKLAEIDNLLSDLARCIRYYKERHKSLTMELNRARRLEREGVAK